MGQYREKLVVATKRLMESGTTEDAAVKSLGEIGIGKSEAKGIVNEAKGLVNETSSGIKSQPSPGRHSNFWDAPVGTYFGGISHDKGQHSKAFSFLKWLIR